jgi:hypothetical protein
MAVLTFIEWESDELSNRWSNLPGQRKNFTSWCKNPLPVSLYMYIYAGLPGWIKITCHRKRLPATHHSTLCLALRTLGALLFKIPRPK